MSRVKFRLGPFDPVFANQTFFGAIDVGNTPADGDYDEVVLVDIGAIWYSRFAGTDAPVWPSYTTVAFGDYRNESVQGLYWFNAWYAESGNVPATYDLTATPLGLLWYSVLDATNAPVWPSYATVVTGDYRNETQQGLYWFNAWYAESGNAPADYDATVAGLGPVWYSKLGSTSSSPGAGLPAGGTITTPGDGYRYHTFLVTDTTSPWFWTMDPSNKMVDIFAIAGGATGGRPNVAGSHGGGGGAGERLHNATLSLDSNGIAITVAAARAVPGAAAQGNDGNNTVLVFNGSTTTLLGGRGGGIATVSAGVGRTGGGSGGGGAASNGPVSGTGGAGATGGNNGGNGAGSATASQNRAGGGGGANAAGTSGVVGGQTGNGGQGYEWPPGSGTRYGGGGGGATGAGTATGGAGGGGNGTTGTGGNATANTGSGGGGGGGTAAPGTGAAGRVMIRYSYP